MCYNKMQRLGQSRSRRLYDRLQRVTCVFYLISLKIGVTPLILCRMGHFFFADPVLRGPSVISMAASCAINILIAARLYDLNNYLSMTASIMTNLFCICIFYPLLCTRVPWRVPFYIVPEGEDNMKLYISHLCPECPPVLALIEKKGLTVPVVDITGSMPALKEFLHLRDSRPEFETRRAGGYVGVPGLITDDDRILFDQDLWEYLAAEK